MNKTNTKLLIPENLANMQGLILGSGYSALAMAKWCHYWQTKFAVVDSREEPPNKKELAELGINILKVCFDNEEIIKVVDLDKLDFVAISPGIALGKKIVEIIKTKNIPIVSEIELFLQATTSFTPNAKIVGVTGSNGKTTVCSLLGVMLSEANINNAVAGNIKPAALEMLLSLYIENKLPDVWVLELSSFQLATTEVLPNRFYCGCVLNFSDNHLDWHPNRSDYYNCKQKLLKMSESFVVNLDDEESQKMAKDAEVNRQICFSIKNSLSEFFYNEEDNYIYYKNRKLINRQESKLIGSHNTSNILAGLALADIVGADLKLSINAIPKFLGIVHRTQFVANINSVEYINDSKSTTVAATLAAIQGIPQSKTKQTILIIGGVGKSQDFSPLAEVINKCVKKLILIGKDALTIQSTLINRLKDLNQKIEFVYEFFNSWESALENAMNIAEKNDCVLFSPACASFDMFLNYEDRGEKFCKWVLRQEEINNLRGIK